MEWTRVLHTEVSRHSGNEPVEECQTFHGRYNQQPSKLPSWHQTSCHHIRIGTKDTVICRTKRKTHHWLLHTLCDVLFLHITYLLPWFRARENITVELALLNYYVILSSVQPASCFKLSVPSLFLYQDDVELKISLDFHSHPLAFLFFLARSDKNKMRMMMQENTMRRPWWMMNDDRWYAAVFIFRYTSDL